MTARGAGALRERVIFQRRGETPDGSGNEITGEWTDQFEEAARLQPRLAGEAVIAARLTGVQPYILTVRSSRRTRDVTTAWRAYDARGGVDPNGDPRRSFAIQSIANVDEKNQYIDFLVAEGQPG